MLYLALVSDPIHKTKALGLAFTRGQRSSIGMGIHIIMSNQIVSLRSIFHQHPVQSIPSSIVVPCKQFFSLQNRPPQFDWVNSHFLKSMSEGELSVHIFGWLGRSHVNNEAQCPGLCKQSLRIEEFLRIVIMIMWTVQVLKA